ncbi:pentapeptide repeat-containing protein [Streptomyces sp. NPDC088124]|uniref:pentapeptide repeat-containing protein n=1 Tax=Streptomyces sp. NPDC088124 TaxID=3154654 RepID=UPI00341AB60E
MFQQLRDEQRFERARLRGACLRGACLGRARLRRARLRRARLRGGPRRYQGFDPVPYRCRSRVPLAAQLAGLPGQSRHRHGGRRVLPYRRRPRRGRGEPGRADPQGQGVHQGRGGEPAGQPGGDRVVAVAQVEAGGERGGLVVQQREESRHGARLTGDRARYGRLVAQAERGQPAQQGEHAPDELEPRPRVAVRVQVRPVLGEDFETAALVAGQRAELDVQADRGQQALVAPGQAVPLEVVGARLVRPAGAYERQQRLGQCPVRLLRAAQPVGENRLPRFQRLLVVALPHAVTALVVQLAGVAVGHPVALRGRPRGEGARRPLRVAAVVGEFELGLAYGAFGEARGAVAALHLREPVLDGGERHLGQGQHPGAGPLEDPVEGVGVRAGEAGRVPVPLLEQPGEGDEHLAALGAVLVRLDEAEQRPAEHVGVAGPLGGGDEFLATRVARQAVGGGVVLPEGASDVLG